MKKKNLVWQDWIYMYAKTMRSSDIHKIWQITKGPDGVGSLPLTDCIFFLSKLQLMQISLGTLVDLITNLLTF